MSIKTKLSAVCLTGSIALSGCANTNEKQAPPEKSTVSAQQSIETKVPALEGKTLNQAIRSIRDANLTYDLTNKDFDVNKERQKTNEWVVENQDKPAGSTVPLQETVNLSLKRK